MPRRKSRVPPGTAPVRLTMAFIVVDPRRPARGVDDTVIVTPLAETSAPGVVAPVAVAEGPVEVVEGLAVVTVVIGTLEEGGDDAVTGVVLVVPDTEFAPVPQAPTVTTRPRATTKGLQLILLLMARRSHLASRPGSDESPSTAAFGRQQPSRAGARPRGGRTDLTTNPSSRKSSTGPKSDPSDGLETQDMATPLSQYVASKASGRGPLPTFPRPCVAHQLANKRRRSVDGSQARRSCVLRRSASLLGSAACQGYSG